MLLQRFKNLRILAVLTVLAVYGTGGILGYGLHNLWHCGHCANDTVRVHESSPCGHHHCCESSRNNKPETELAYFVINHKDCSICAFLAKAQSPTDAVEASIYYESVVSMIPASEEIVPLFLPSDHLARGPPCST